MHRILVVAHKTLGGPHLLEEVRQRMQRGECSVHLVVPVIHPFSAFTEASLQAEAQHVLDEGLRRFRELDPTGRMEVTGEVGDANPAYAAEVVKNRGVEIDEVIVSTLPRGASRWLLGNVPKKVERVFPDTEVTHVVAAEQPAPA
jgi:nucleotide-binding universal stress UspA family protein